MSVVIFSGPTLSSDEVAQRLDAVCLPPVAQGDLYRAARRRPRVIGIIDGYFERVPAVWHKEVLWALSQGIHVFGSASMGALRAAELYAFGMVGVGEIFEWYRDGILEADDEVAVLHASADEGFRSMTVPLVNVRATLRAAFAEHVLTPAAHDRLLASAAMLHYTVRTYPLICRSATESGLDPDALAPFRAWLPAGTVDLKRRDAFQMLGVICEELPNLEPKQVAWVFENTTMWQQAVNLLAEDD